MMTDDLQTPVDDRWSFAPLDHEVLAAGDPDRALALAEMAYSAAPDFYDMVPMARAELLKLIASQIGAPDTETSTAYAVVTGGQIAGLVSVLSSERLDRAKQDATLAIIRRLDKADRAAYMERLGAYTPTVEPLAAESFYLTRIAVGPHIRRTGAGAAGMRYFLELGEGRFLSLHVKADNDPAISLYRKFGFDFVSDGAFRFRAMLRMP